MADNIETMAAAFAAKLVRSIEQSRPLCPDHRDKARGHVCLLCEIERLRAKLDVVADLVDDVLFDPHWKPVDGDGCRIRGDELYMLNHPVQEDHMPALRAWFVKQSREAAQKAAGGDE